VRWNKGGCHQLERTNFSGAGIPAATFRLLAGLVRKAHVHYRIAAFCTVSKRDNYECGASPQIGVP